MTHYIIGVDPSSRKLAAVIASPEAESKVRTAVKALPQDKPTACLMAFEWLRALVESLDGDVYVFIELPVFGRGGPGSTIPQAQVNGALLAGGHRAGASVNLVNNARVKKEIVGKGNATKDDIRDWVRESWPALYEEIESDQDLCDSAMIYRYGCEVVEHREKITRK